MNFSNLVSLIDKTHNALQSEAIKAININLTIRNWLIGFYIVEFEQNGEDRAKYGEKLLLSLEKELTTKGISNSNSRELRRYRTFYSTYQYFGAFIFNSLPSDAIWGTPSPISGIVQKWGTLSPISDKKDLQIPAEKIIYKLSFSHLAELIMIDDELKRVFYEIECIKGCWTVRELERQINTLYYERMGLSSNPEKMSQIIQSGTEILLPQEAIKDHFSFEFLGIKHRELIEETDLEQSLIDNFQYFMLELGRGFCLEARQKRILIGDEYFFVDLVFYHRILRCHIIVELKADKFNHSHISQLNTYVNFFKKEICDPNDNPPIGILLVAEKNKPLVEFALAGIENNLFVSKYLLQLPTKEQLTNFIANEIQNY